MTSVGHIQINHASEPVRLFKSDLATHHIPMRKGIWKAPKRHHLRHHYKTPDQRFGVSSPLWDLVFRTLPAE